MTPDSEPIAAAIAVIDWALDNDEGLRPLFDQKRTVATSVVPTEPICHALRRSDVRATLVTWAEFAADRWPDSWAKATGFCRAWMMEQARLYQSFDSACVAAHVVSATGTPAPDHSPELMDLLAVGLVASGTGRQRKTP